MTPASGECGAEPGGGEGKKPAGSGVSVNVKVTKNALRGRYEVAVEGSVVGEAHYRVDGDKVVFFHTVIDRPRRGQGLGAELIRFALDDVRSTGRTVVPRCWFVARFIEENPGYADLLAA